MKEVLQWLSDQTCGASTQSSQKHQGKEGKCSDKYTRRAPQSFTDIRSTAPCQGRDKNRKDFAALQRARNRASFPPATNLLFFPHLSVLSLCSQRYNCLCHNLVFFLFYIVLYLDGLAPSLRFSVESRTPGLVICSCSISCLR